jgi:hypothetical protein
MSWIRNTAFLAPSPSPIDIFVLATPLLVSRIYDRIALNIFWLKIRMRSLGVQDGKSRVSLVSGQPLGGTSLASGQLEAGRNLEDISL